MRGSCRGSIQGGGMRSEWGCEGSVAGGRSIADVRAKELGPTGPECFRPGFSSWKVTSSKMERPPLRYSTLIRGPQHGDERARQRHQEKGVHCPPSSPSALLYPILTMSRSKRFSAATVASQRML